MGQATYSYGGRCELWGRLPIPMVGSELWGRLPIPMVGSELWGRLFSSLSKKQFPINFDFEWGRAYPLRKANLLGGDSRQSVY